jgi:hypothetical protein
MSEFKEKMKERYSEDFADIEFIEDERCLVMRLHVEEEDYEVGALPGDGIRKINFKDKWIDVEFW